MIQIGHQVAEQLHKAATAAAPAECGGLLSGPTADTITTATPVPNVAAEPQTRYELEPAGVPAPLEAIDAAAAGHIGFYHSHPRCPL